jgi:hypothetical protein
MRSFILIFLLASCELLSAQSIERYVISNCGGSYYDGSNITVDYTTGELATATIGNTSNILTQGFQQPFINSVSSVQQAKANNVQVRVFPNPVTAHVYININNVSDRNYQVLLYDIRGKLIAKETRSSGTEGTLKFQLDIETLANGNYFITVLHKKNIIATEKIIKTN